MRYDRTPGAWSVAFREQLRPRETVEEVSRRAFALLAHIQNELGKVLDRLRRAYEHPPKTEEEARRLIYEVGVKLRQLYDLVTREIPYFTSHRYEIKAEEMYRRRP